MSDTISTKAVRCPSCGSPLSPELAEPDVVTCKACGAVLDVSSSEEAALLTTIKPKDFAPASFLKLGMVGTIEGKKYQIIGRICYDCRIREWDPEDSQYYRDVWKFDEWILVGENKEYIYINEDLEGYSIERSFTPTAPKIPDASDSFLALDSDQHPQRIQEFGEAKIVHFEGEFTWVPRIGEVVEAAEYKYGYLTYCVEWRRKPDSSDIEEVEFFKSTPATRLDLAKAFGEREIIEEEHRKAEISRQYGMWSAAFFGAAGVSLLLLVYSLLAGGNKVAELEVDFGRIPSQGLMGKAIKLTDKGSVHKLELQTSIRDNSWAWGGVELLDSSQKVVNAFEEEFWRESGRDSDGAWSERNTNRSTYFRLEEPGVYYPRFFVDGGTARSGELRLTVYEGVVLSRYYLIAFLLSLGLAYSIRRFKTLNPLYAVIGILLLGYIILEMLPESD